MADIKFDKEKCVKCGACIKDCITYSITTNEEGYPTISTEGDSRCISCQHCFAICPTGAITFENKKPENAYNIENIDESQILNLIQSRRSIRQFKDEQISKEQFEKLKNMFPFIPTGCNYNSLHFSIIESKSAMDTIRNYVNSKILKLVSNKFTQKYAGKFAAFKKAFENGEDIIFRNAPHMIIVSSDIKAPCANVDPIIALSYIELYAYALGLGTCWCGFAQACFKILPKLASMVNIPEGYKPVYVMLIGKPSVKYSRTTLPENFPISEISEIHDIKINWIEKVKRIFFNFIR